MLDNHHKFDPNVYTAPLNLEESFDKRYGPNARVTMRVPYATLNREEWTFPRQPAYDKLDHLIWAHLYASQTELLETRACAEYLENLKALNLPRDRIPDFDELNAALREKTGWEVVAVPSLIPDDVFFRLLAEKKFPVGAFIRGRSWVGGGTDVGEREDGDDRPLSDAEKLELKYVEEPDIFHDILGHVPLLMHEPFANFMEKYGLAGAKARSHNQLKALGALYWYTVEFGLIQQGDGLRIYGAGIMSSPDECRYALHAQSPNRIHLNVARTMATAYKIDDLQNTYFVIKDFDELYALAQEDFDRIYKRLTAAATYASTAILDVDRVHHAGTQQYHLCGGARNWDKWKALARTAGHDDYDKWIDDKD